MLNKRFERDWTNMRKQKYQRWFRAGFFHIRPTVLLLWKEYLLSYGISRKLDPKIAGNYYGDLDSIATHKSNVEALRVDIKKYIKRHR